VAVVVVDAGGICGSARAHQARRRIDNDGNIDGGRPHTLTRRVSHAMTRMMNQKLSCIRMTTRNC
jgi:hypothetical protein